MAYTVKDFVKKHGSENISSATGINATTLKRYEMGQSPNGFNSIALYQFSLQISDPLLDLQPDESSWNVQLAQWLIRHKKSPYTFAREKKIPESTFIRYVSGQVSDLNRVEPARIRKLYEATSEEGDPLEIFKTGGVEITSQETVASLNPSNERMPTPVRILREKLVNLFDDLSDVLPHLEDVLDPENLKKIAAQKNSDKRQMPRIARDLAYELSRILEYYASADQPERERFRKVFYADKRAVTNLAQLIDSLRSEEGIDRLKSLRSFR